MSLYRDEGVVLRTQKLGEADRIITLLTREHGRVRAVAKGVRRTSSKFGARLEPFSHVDIQLYVGRSLDIVTQVESFHAYGSGLAADYARYTAGTAMLETAERLTDEEGEPAVQQYLLLVGGLRALAAKDHDSGLVLDAYLLRSLAVAGWAQLRGLRPVRSRGPPPGVRHPGRWGGVQRVPSSRLVHPGPRDRERLLAALLGGDWAVADVSLPRHRHEASGLTAAYLQWHLERGLRSLRLVERA